MSDLTKLELLNCAQMRAAEQAVMKAGLASGLELMERAGQGVVEAVFETWPELKSPSLRAVVLCGPGNNGGDGFVIARLLKQMGWRVDVFFLGDPDALSQDARINYDRWLELGAITPLSDDALDGYATRWPDAKLAIDALFGTGLSRPFLSFGNVQDELNYWQAASENGDCPYVVSVDVPSGLCADSGRYLGYSDENPFDSAIMANLTVSFHCLKLGHVLAEGPQACGKVVVKDIGCTEQGVNPSAATLVTHDLKMAHHLCKAARGHKYTNGAALVLCGGFGKSGAARLAARAALRVGAGVVTLGVPHDAQNEVAAQITALMMTRIEDISDLSEALRDPRIRALCIGPGLGLERAKSAVQEALINDTRRSVVLDADALTAFENDPSVLFDLLHEGCVLTPHMGEFARLFPDIAARLNEPALVGPAYSKVDAVRAAAQRAGCTILLKGADTVVATEAGECAVHSASGARAAPWLASAGAGDVLAGILCGLLARGLPMMQAAQTAAWLHVSAAIAAGPGMIAEDLPETLQQAIADVLDFNEN